MKLKTTFTILMLTALFTGKSNAQDWANLNRFKNENAQLAPPAPGEQRVVFMGNSITEGWANACPDFFAGKPYINRAIGGQTTPQMLVRFRADVVALRPSVVVILAGTNDIAGNTGPSTVGMIADNIKSMAEIARANDIEVVISSVLPVFDYPWKPGLNPSGKIIELNQILKTYADEHGLVYLDYFTAMVDERNGMKPEFAPDGVHPNEAGYRVMAPLAEAAIAKALNKK